MRIRTAVATLGLAVLGIGAAAGPAAALEPFHDPELGVIGVDLNQSDTAALSNSPLPQLLDPLLGNAIYVTFDVDLESAELEPEFRRGPLPGGFSGFVADTAQSRGVMGVMVGDGNTVLVYQAVPQQRG
ncbi:hypothetical protein NONI108955_20415 [Nocardia ninae]|uniref:Uncharacterized protein n=1 Tax=Nocardia ninae NBRC 108245 TaxID=1210091 RepID=A0A511ME05_9NOCA|nr:hypothetical protein [Nocardia ninae]GEM38328.1 hypothetical protein NN4_28470 [Nocardia ninae NBRC 108245]